MYQICLSPNWTLQSRSRFCNLHKYLAALSMDFSSMYVRSLHCFPMSVSHVLCIFFFFLISVIYDIDGWISYIFLMFCHSASFRYWAANASMVEACSITLEVETFCPKPLSTLFNYFKSRRVNVSSIFSVTQRAGRTGEWYVFPLVPIKTWETLQSLICRPAQFCWMGWKSRPAM